MIEIIVGIVSGIISAMGFGGGSVLIIYLTVFAGMEAVRAQGINLIYFIPVAVTAIIFHIINKKIDFKVALFLILAGLPGAALGGLAAQMIGKSSIMQFLLAGFILIIGIKELLSSEA